MNDLNKTLRGQAVELGLCQQWQDEWSDNKSRGELIAMFMRGIDFCIEHDWPSSQWITGHFAADELRRGGVFVADKAVNTNIPEGVYFFKDCGGEVAVDRFAVCTVHCAGCANLRFTLSPGAKLFIHAHDSRVVVDARAKMSAAWAYTHRGSEVEKIGNVAQRAPPVR